jgi:hypothetical protein
VKGVAVTRGNRRTERWPAFGQVGSNAFGRKTEA